MARKIVELAMADIRRRSPVPRELGDSGAIRIAGAMYDVTTAGIDFFA